MKRVLGNRGVSKSSCTALFTLCLVLLVTGCKTGSNTPPPDTIPPSAPSGLTATAVSATQINLAWTASTDNVGVTAYKVERCQGTACSNFAQIATPTGTTFNDTGLTGSTSYGYRVRATDAANNLSPYSTAMSAATAAPTFTVPSNLTATAAGSTQINLSWTAATETGGTITQYLIERCSGANCGNTPANFAQVGTSATVTFNNTGLTASTSYSYRVRATDAAANLGPYSSPASATTLVNSPSAPSNLTATAAGPVLVNLSWTASTETGGTISQYLVERCTGVGCSNFAQVGTSATTTFNDSGLLGSTRYSYRVRAEDTLNVTGPYSNMASATTAAPTFTAPSSLAALAAGNTQINLSWTAATETGGTLTNYLIERCTGAACGNFAQVGTSATTAFNNTGLLGSTSYTYRVRATDAANNFSAYSNTSSATTAAPTFTAPSNLTATAASSTQINLSWTAATETGGTITQYLIERCSGANCGNTPANFAQVGTSATVTFNNTGLTASTSYSYRVRATDAANNLGPYSSTATAATLAPGPISVSITPVRGGLAFTQTLPFTATVTNDIGGAGVTWNATAAGCVGLCGAFGMITPTSATYIAPSIAGVVTVTATSKADMTKSASATIGVTDLTGVTTWRYDNTRAGANIHEFALTTSSVTSATFGKLFSCAIDAPAYSEPLWVANLNIGGGTHNVVIVATQHNSVYAFDADASSCTTYWSHVDAGKPVQRLVPSGETFLAYTDVGSDDIFPDIGIVGTPVIDPSTKTIYLVTKSKVSSINPVTDSSVHQRVHALSLTDGTEKLGGPTDIAASVPGIGDGSSGGTQSFRPMRQNQRPALTLLNGTVYIAWASHGDNNPYQGWILAYNAANLTQQVAKFNTAPDGSPQARAGIWQSGNGLAADTNGNLYCLTGNGAFDGTFPPVPGSDDYGDSALKFSTSSGLALADFFTPHDQNNLNAGDTDLGSGGVVILPDQSVGGHPHLLLSSSKSGTIYLIDRDNMGKFNSSSDLVVQEFGAAASGFWSTPAFWQNTMYDCGVNNTVDAWPFSHNTAGQFDASPTSSSSSAFLYGFPGASPVVSASGTTNGIVWAIDSSNYGPPHPTSGPAILHAYDATNLGTELWNSTQGSGNTAGNAVKFTVPIVANGKVYIGTRTELDVYGLLPN